MDFGCNCHLTCHWAICSGAADKLCILGGTQGFYKISAAAVAGNRDSVDNARWDCVGAAFPEYQTTIERAY